MSLPDPNQKRDILEIIDRGGDILEYFRKIDPICSEIGTNIALGEKLGEGSYGTVFKVDSKLGDVIFNGQIPSRLVVKKINAPMVKKVHQKAREGENPIRESERALTRYLYTKLFKEDPAYDAASLNNTAIQLPRALLESCQKEVLYFNVVKSNKHRCLVFGPSKPTKNLQTPLNNPCKVLRILNRDRMPHISRLVLLNRPSLV